MSVLISAVVCTLDRADYLRKALRSLTEQTLPHELYEILVVDNAPASAATREVVSREFSGGANLRYLHEPVLGANRARNTGWRNARGEYVAFTDDDVIVGPGWLETIVRAFETSYPQPGCVGGRVEPIWEAPRPAWLPDDMAAFLAILDLSSAPVALGPGQMLFSANIAFPRHVLQAMGGFDTYMGRKGNKLLSMDEILLQQRIKQGGYSCLYHPDIAVRHHIPPSRLTRGWFRRRLYWEGVSLAAARTHLETLSRWGRVCKALSAARGLLLSPGELANLAIVTNDPSRFSRQCRTFHRLGYLAGLCYSAE